MNTLLPPYTPLPLPPELVETLHQSNPWWRGEPAPPVPATRRHLVGQIRQRLGFGITPIVAVPGPRGAGKTTTQLQIINDLLDEGVPPHHIIRVPLDQVTATKDMLDCQFSASLTEIFTVFDHLGSGAIRQISGCRLPVNHLLGC